LPLHPSSIPFSAFVCLPGSEDILQVQKIHYLPLTDVEQQPSSLKKIPSILNCNGIPPVPTRLLKMVKERMQIEMSELFPDHLSTAKFNFSDQSANSKPKLCEMNNIMD